MELQSGLPLLIQQYKALLVKNAILSWRNRRSTIAQLLSPVFFMFLLLVVTKAFRTQNGKPVYDPEALISPPIPPCEDKFYIRRPCFDFAWSGNQSASISSIVSRIMANNPGRPIPPGKVKSFRTKKEVDEWFFNDPLRCPGALHFEERNDTVLSYGVQTNSTQIPKQSQFEDPTFKFQIPLQIAAEREITRFLIEDPNFIWVVGLKEFAHPVLGTSATDAEHESEVMNSAGPVFFLASAMFSFVFQINYLVTEKELKLRQSMTMMGLYDTPYWLSWLTWQAILELISSLITVLCGKMFQISIFLRNSFVIVFLVFFLFRLSMIGFAFMVSTSIRKSSSSTMVGFFIFIVGFVAQMAVQATSFPYNSSYSVKFQLMWSLFPPNLLSKAVSILANATFSNTSAGISWSKRSMCPELEPNCEMTINGIFMWCLAIFFLWFIIAIYLDNIFLNSSGVRKSIFYFLNPQYWMGTGGNIVQEGGFFSCLHSAPRVEYKTPDDEDVFEEENTVKQQAKEGVVDPNVAVQICGLVKTYLGKTQIGCCKYKRKSYYHAVKGLWVSIPKDQLFCLLGPNGAGKTTTISCLTGIAPVTSGDALVYGHSVRSYAGMSNVRKFLGVCPQFDILWDALTAEEHLHLFASIKGLPASSIKLVAQKSLVEVRLTREAKTRAGGCNGGMKRQLSVAIALIGDPKLIILDEPTTGMDPESQKHIWDTIANAKKGRAIILTTHSMEEADILSDRLGIMARGTLRCIGTSTRLKSRLGSGLVINMSFSESTTDTTSKKDARKELKDFFVDHLDVVQKEERKYFLSYIILPNQGRLLTGFLAKLEEREREFGIADVQLGLTTLEEVFLNVARKPAAAENAAVEKNLVRLTLASGDSILIPVGVEHIGIPGTESPQNPRGLMVEVYWGKDYDGNLYISDQSAETPIPDTIRHSVPSTPHRKLGHKGPVHGIVLGF